MVLVINKLKAIEIIVSIFYLFIFFAFKSLSSFFQLLSWLLSTLLVYILNNSLIVQNFFVRITSLILGQLELFLLFLAPSPNLIFDQVIACQLTFIVTIFIGFIRQLDSHKLFKLQTFVKRDNNLLFLVDLFSFSTFLSPKK